MIVPMKKLTLLVSARDRRAALVRLRTLGVLHVKNIKAPSADEIYELQSQLTDIEKTRLILEGDVTETRQDMDAAELVKKTLELSEHRDTLRAELNEKNEAMKWFQEWGKVSLASLQKLQDAGLFVRFYKTDKDGLKRIPEEKQIAIVEESKEGVKLILLASSETDSLDLIESRMPLVEVSEMEARIEALNSELEQIEREITKLVPYKGVLSEYEKAIQKKLELGNVLYGMADEGEFAYLQGFCPVDSLKDIEAAADKNGWGLVIEDPDDPSEVPTLLRNPKPVRIVQPLFDFMGTLPGYREMDISFIFLLFFSVFYAMIVGDGGYGLIFLGLTIWARLKFKKAPSEPFTLFFVLSTGTIVWGAITGTWFGSQAISQWPILKALIIPQVYSFAGTDAAQNFMMKLTFTIGITSWCWVKACPPLLFICFMPAPRWWLFLPIFKKISLKDFSSAWATCR